MKKRNLMFASLISLFSILITSCGGETITSSSEDKPSESTSEVVPSESSSEETSTEPVIELKQDERENYEIDGTITNKDGSAAYEIFVRSYYDSDNNGIGDLNGVTYKLPYIASLGVKTIWLMPINPAATYHGYDVMDYYGINKDYGTMDDFINLVAKAKEYNIDIMMDMVLNHSSNQHPWFFQSYDDLKANKTGPDSKADWYNWSDKSKSNYHEYKDLYYEGQFGTSMPDLNWDSESLKKEVESIIKFWIEKGVKGFRLDAVIHYYNGVKKSRDVLDYIDATAKKYDPNFYLVAEAWKSNPEIEEYAKSNCESYFKFSSSLATPGDESIFGFVSLLNDASGFSSSIEYSEANLKKANPNAYYSYFVGNHDTDRIGSYVSNADEAKMIASLYLLMPGRSYVYYGEEVQMLGSRNSEDYSDARRRLPMVWGQGDVEGECDFPEPIRTDLMDNEQVELGADDHDKVGYSITNHYRKVINVRNKYPFMKHGIYTSKVDEINCENDKVLAYEISLEDEKITIIHNFSSKNVELNVQGLGNSIDAEINTARLIPELNNGMLKLAKYSSVVLK